MPILVECIGCGSKFRASEDLAGERVKCPNCSAILEVPRDQSRPAEGHARTAIASPKAKPQPDQTIRERHGPAATSGVPLSEPTAAKKRTLDRRTLIVLGAGGAGLVLLVLLIVLLPRASDDPKAAKNTTTLSGNQGRGSPPPPPPPSANPGDRTEQADSASRGKTSTEPTSPSKVTTASALDYIGPDTILVYALRPPRVAKSSLGRKLAQDGAIVRLLEKWLTGNPFAALHLPSLLGEQRIRERFPKSADDLLRTESVTSLMLPAANDLQADDKESDWLSRVTVFRFSSEVNGKRLWQELMGEMYTRAGLKPRSMIETAIDGRTCYKMDRYGELVLCVPDARTVIEAEATSVPRLLAARRSQGPAAERLRRAGADWDAIVVLALERNRASIIQKMTSDSKNAPLPLMPFLEIAALLDGATLTLNLSGENLLDGRFEATDAQNAAKLEQLLRKALDMAKTQLAALRQRSGKGTSKWMAPTLALGEQALTSIRLSRDANQVRVSLPRTPAVEEAILRLAREAARTALQKLSEPESLDTPEVSYERP